MSVASHDAVLLDSLCRCLFQICVCPAESGAVVAENSLLPLLRARSLPALTLFLSPISRVVLP